MSGKENGNAQQDAMRFCYVCRMPISVLAIKCRYCGADVGRPRKEQETFTVEDLGGEKIGTYTISGNVTDALESFIQEERAQLKEEERERIEMNRNSLMGKLRRITGADAGVPDDKEIRNGTRDTVDIEAINLSAPMKKPDERRASNETRQRVIVVALIMAVLAAVYLVLHFSGSCLGGQSQEGGSDAGADVPNHALEILASGGSLLDAHEQAFRALKRNESGENKRIIREIRVKIIEDIKSRLYAKPFDLKN